MYQIFLVVVFLPIISFYAASKPVLMWLQGGVVIWKPGSYDVIMYAD